ncbi:MULTISPECIES: SsgA family sporulation/cell division regulator [unclassified Streptomyces]|uniref:SsgA family sporulation/cell division regulator n=1 Tax=unclassified Streptomyces TaxID=2593676 RepID=UPI00225A51F2|nr:MULTISPECIES: SsgA family sporulation/cell division regulator [unclassified Streptomyces]MCX4878585.1 SsgA family sporulation/cell division regulator [Streptomyces sp. NBC_00847]MCX5418601.1 SsgA family sporulation/cell division regulator [Streptomyces sp. NBC_00078]
MDITLRQPAHGRLITADEQELPVPATLRYAATDPLAVYLDFPPEVSLDGTGVTWTFGRSLLEEGLRGPAGGGDVHIWPCGRARTVVEFHSPYGLALLQFDTDALRRFLLRTYAVVAAGQEDVGAAVDEGLNSLFGSV